MKRIHSYTFAATLIVIGLSILCMKHVQALTPRFSTTTPHAELVSSVVREPSDTGGIPIGITVPRLGLRLAVEPGQYNPASKTWNVSTSAAQYATITPPANTKSGNTFIYGHNLPAVFGRLPELSTGDMIILTTDTGHKLSYRLTSKRETNPNDDSLFYYSGPPIVTVQTCSGLFDQNRQLFTFELSGVLQ